MPAAASQFACDLGAHEAGPASDGDGAGSRMLGIARSFEDLIDSGRAEVEDMLELVVDGHPMPQ